MRAKYKLFVVLIGFALAMLCQACGGDSPPRNPPTQSRGEPIPEIHSGIAGVPGPQPNHPPEDNDDDPMDPPPDSDPPNEPNPDALNINFDQPCGTGQTQYFFLSITYDPASITGSPTAVVTLNKTEGDPVQITACADNVENSTECISPNTSFEYEDVPLSLVSIDWGNLENHAYYNWQYQCCNAGAPCPAEP